jgi:hypothetical protein
MTMKMVRFPVFLSLLATACAAPALVWKSGVETLETVYNTVPTSVNELFRNEPSAVVFVLARDADGNDSLTQIAPQLTGVASMRDPAFVHSHVMGVQTQMKGASRVSLADLAMHLNASSSEEIINVDGSIAQMKRKKAPKNSVWIVPVDARTDPAALDAAVVNAIEQSHKGGGSVILTAIRSTKEVKMERELEQRRRLSVQHKAGQSLEQQNGRRRRLEDQAKNDDANNNNSDLQGVYYVALTPNILAGLLFFLLFTAIAYIGISCMGAIQGQDTFVTKMPTVGREA